MLCPAASLRHAGNLLKILAVPVLGYSGLVAVESDSHGSRLLQVPRATIALRLGKSAIESSDRAADVASISCSSEAIAVLISSLDQRAADAAGIV